MNQGNGPKDVKVTADKGLLRLQFSSNFSRKIFQRRQFFKSLGKKDNQENREWALRIALNIQHDFNNGEFDPSLEKYLGDRQSPKPKYGVTLGDLWDDFALYKLNIGRIHQTTYNSRYNRTFRNWIKPWLAEIPCDRLVDLMASQLIQSENYKPNLKKLFFALVEMGERATKLEKIEKNYFDGLTDIAKNIKHGKKSQQLSAIQDYRAFSKDERDLIIKSFYESQLWTERRLAELVEFLFLTGCREGEAFALKWNDIKDDYIIFDESYSSESKLEKATKTNTVRIFKISGYNRLLDLLHRLKNDKNKPADHVFMIAGKPMNRHHLSRAWHGKYHNQTFYPGIVKSLELDGKLEYLKPSSTRHTFISIQVRNGTDIKLIADSVGNSPQTIFKHYLGSDSNSIFVDD